MTQETSSPAAPAVGSNAKLKILQERYNAEGTQETVEAESLGGLSSTDSEHALVVHQTFNQQNRLEKTKLTINSPHILNALQEVVGSYPTVADDFTKPFDLEDSFHLFFHNWDELTSYRHALSDDEARAHLDLLLEFMHHELGKERRTYLSQINKGQIDYYRSWMIFRPGDLVVNYIKEHPWLMKVAKTAYEKDERGNLFLEVHCTHTDYDGTRVGEAKRVVKIPQREHFGQGNPSNITELPIYPRSYLVDDDGLEARLIERGAQFLALQDVTVQQYNGLADYLKTPPRAFFHTCMEDFQPVWLPFTESGRCIVDRKTFQEDHYQKSVSKQTLTGDMEKLLCPPFVYGFSCGRKEWCRFYLGHLTTTSWNQHAFDSLILPPAQLSMIRALVSSHRFSDNARDQMEQKGRGLVCLLSGPPGSGKTLTAECVAELTQRALFSASMSELNKWNDPYDFEIELKNILRYATIMKAVVLLDEADVFLESRSENSSEAASRNALVAVFLRHLEYFSGIVFLTTNRIQVFDAAMKSRVHFTLAYGSPGEESRRRIWTQALRKIPAHERDLEMNDSIHELGKEPLNGREITNTINTASTLARFDKVPLAFSHIQAVLSVRKEFDANLAKIGASSLVNGETKKVGKSDGGD